MEAVKFWKGFPRSVYGLTSIEEKYRRDKKRTQSIDAGR